MVDNHSKPISWKVFRVQRNKVLHFYLIKKTPVTLSVTIEFQYQLSPAKESFIHQAGYEALLCSLARHWSCESASASNWSRFSFICLSLVNAGSGDSDLRRNIGEWRPSRDSLRKTKTGQTGSKDDETFRHVCKFSNYIILKKRKLISKHLYLERERKVKSLFFAAKTSYLGPEYFFLFHPPQTPTCNIAETRSIKDGAQAVLKISFVIKHSCPPNKDTNAPWTTIDLDSLRNILSGNTVNVANKIALIVDSLTYLNRG